MVSTKKIQKNKLTQLIQQEHFLLILVKRAKFSPHVMVSSGVCFGGKGRLHFVPEKVKVNADFYVNYLLPKLFKDCERLLPNNFYFSKMVHQLIHLASFKNGSSGMVQCL